MAEMVGSRPRKPSARGTLIGGLIALVSFLLLLPLIVTLSSRSAVTRAPALPPRTSVVIAAKNIAPRQTLGAADVAVKQMYTEDVPAGAFSNVAQVKGMIAAAKISAGQPLTPSLIAKPGDDVVLPDMAYLGLPTGYVAMTIPTNEQQGVAGYIRPGDYISVVAVVPIAGGTGSAGNTRTVLTNVHVLRVGVPGQKTGPSAANQSSQSNQGANSNVSVLSSSLTVVITQCQAELLNWFLSNAQVRYTLQSSKDYPTTTETDPTCPTVTSGQGLNRAEIARRYPGIFTP